jgi:hypothetical protein
MHVNFEQLDACRVDMQPTSMMIPQSQMTPECIEKAESKAACMVAEITKTYAGKVKLYAPLTKKDTPLVTTLIQHEPVRLLFGG